MKSIGMVVLVLVVLVVVAISLTIGWRPFIGPKMRPLTNRKFESTPERLARGKYLTNSLTGCFHCHSEHDWKKPGGPIIGNTAGAGQQSLVYGLPGSISPPNITPDVETGAGSWTDDQLARAIREGIGHDGRTLFPLMPYDHYRHMSDEDLASIIVYIRSIPAIRRPMPPNSVNFPVKYLIRSAPEPITEPVPAPDLSTPVKRGEYLVQLGGCSDCHTPQSKGQPNEKLAFAGGFRLTGPFGDAVSVNITPDPSGISYYDENMFLQVMRTGKVGARTLNPIMPWSGYGTMTDEDLKAVFSYLRTLKPIHHRVDNTATPTPCKVCGEKHGAGDQN